MQDKTVAPLATLARTKCHQGMQVVRGLFCLLLWAGSASAQPGPGISLTILNERQPPGGMLEMKVVLTEPEPIIIGGIALEFEPGPLGSVEGAALFSPSGDVSGAALINGNLIYISFNAPQGSFGTVRDLPIAAVAIPVRADARLGDQSRLTIDPNASWWVDPFGDPYAQEVRPGLLTVGGNLSITDVVPGSAVVPANSLVTVMGMGFQPGARIQIEGADVVSTRFVSSTRLEGIVAQDTQMHGKRVRVRNPDQTIATYYSFFRSVPQGESSRRLLAQTVPIFALAVFSEAYFNPIAGTGQFAALAFQTPGAESADIAIEAYSAAGDFIGSTNFTLPQGMRISREVSEFLPDVTFSAGSYLRAVSTIPVQMLGLVGDEGAGTVVPVDPSPVALY